MSAPPVFTRLLGTRVRLELAAPGGTVEVDVIAVDSVGVYGSLVDLPGLLEFWPWHRIAGAGAVKRQNELQLEPDESEASTRPPPTWPAAGA